MSKLILLVDDDSDIVNLFKDLLENKNCESDRFYKSTRGIRTLQNKLQPIWISNF